MPKIIFTSCYMRDALPAQLKNYVRYIGTSEGVEKVDESKLQLAPICFLGVWGINKVCSERMTNNIG